MVEATDEKGGDAMSLIPLGRIADPQEVTNLVLFSRLRRGFLHYRE